MQSSTAFEVRSGFLRSLMRAALPFGLLVASGCSVDSGGEESAELVGSADEALHAGGGSLPWRGNIPLFPTQSSAEAGKLTVVYGIDFGMTRVCEGGVLGQLQKCWHELKGLQVMSYTPSKASNVYTAGDPTYSKVIGQTNAGSWTRQLCPGGSVVSGYDIWARSMRVEKLQLKCRNLQTGVQTSPYSPVGSTALLFSEFLSCPDYVGSFSINGNGTGMGAACVKK
jgi:hypothetical protein